MLRTQNHQNATRNLIVFTWWIVIEEQASLSSADTMHAAFVFSMVDLITTLECTFALRAFGKKPPASTRMYMQTSRLSSRALSQATKDGNTQSRYALSWLLQRTNTQ